MKNLIKSAIVGLAFVGVAQAVPSTVTQNSTQNLTTATSTFTFNQFDATLGTLSAVDVIIQSSTIQGNITISRAHTGSRTFTDLNAALGLFAIPGITGDVYPLESYFSSALSFLRSPSGNFTIDSTTPTQLITVNGTTQSLIGNSPVTLSVGSEAFSSYIGSSTVGFGSTISLVRVSGGGSAATDMDTSNFFSPTTISLRYTYTSDPAAVPEPGQVAASLLLLGGIGGYVFIKRRRKSTVAAP
jgi:hypothetical protein